MKPIIAIIGRPNVGKSTLFNRFVKERQAIVSDFPGLTRDRIYGESSYNEIPFIVIDTGGIVFHEADNLRRNVLEQSLFAIEEADIVLLLLDGKHGLHPLDKEIVLYLRKQNKKTLFLINKIDSNEYRLHESDFFSLGIDNFYPISAEHNRGIDDLEQAIFKDYSHLSDTAVESKDVTPIAFVGRPNVGKSSLINRITQKNRHIVHASPGTTLDATASYFSYNKREYELVDTAGLRKKAKTKEAILFYSALRTLRAIDAASIILYMFDSASTPSDEDAKILHYADTRGKGLILIFNKWDLVEKETNTYRIFTEKINRDYSFASYAPVLFISAKTGQRVYAIFDTIEKVAENRKRKIKTKELNTLIQSITVRKKHPIVHSKNVRMKYISQIRTNPPLFQIMSNYPELVSESYRRYIVNSLRESFEFTGVPLRIVFKKG